MVYIYIYTYIWCIYIYIYIYILQKSYRDKNLNIHYVGILRFFFGGGHPPQLTKSERPNALTVQLYRPQNPVGPRKL
jgi:hypothetical protein